MATRQLSTKRILNLASDPVSGTAGELYFNTAIQEFRFHNGLGWTSFSQALGGSEQLVSDTQPLSPNEGDIWFNSSTGKTYFYYGSVWVEIGTSEGGRPLVLSGDVTGTGTDNIATTLGPSGVSAGTYGSTTSIPVVTVDVKGRVTNISVSEISAGTSLNVAGETVKRDAEQSFDITGIDFDTTDTISSAVGRLNWDSGEGTLSLGLAGGNVNLQLGQENVVRCYNGTGTTIADGTVVYINGAQGQRPSLARAQGNAEATSSKTLGLATEDIVNGAEGFVTTFGLINGLDTSAFTAGQALWLSPTVAGGLTATKPVAPNHAVFVGYVVSISATAGRIFVNPQNGYELDEIHDVLITSKTDNDIISYDGTTSVWRNQNLATAITEVDGAGSLIDADLLDGQQGAYYLDTSATAQTKSGDLIVGGALTVTGNLTINGTTTTVNSTTLTLDDPILTLGGDTAPTSNDSKDRGIEFRYFDTQARLGFMGWDNSTNTFVFLTQATNTSEVYTGTKATIDANLSGTNINAGTVSATYIDSAIARLSGPTFTGTVSLPTATTKIGQTFLIQGGAVNITFPTVAGTLIGTGDTGTITTSMLASSSSTTTGVTYAKMQFVSAQYRLLGRITAAAGVVEELTPDNIVTTLGQATVTTSRQGTGAIVLATSPTLITPVLGVATATSINKVGITAPTTSATLTLADGSTLATSGAFSITLTSTAATNVTLPTTGTLVNTSVTTLSSLSSIGTITTGVWNAGAVTSSGAITGNNGAQGLTLGPSTLDHTYIGFNARTSTPTTRSAYIGFPAAASNALTIANEINGGTVAINTNAGSISTNSNLSVTGTVTATTFSGSGASLTNVPNSALAGSGVTTINGTSVTLGGTATVTAAAGTLTGTTLNSTVTGSSLTSVATITNGTWNAGAVTSSGGISGTTGTFSSYIRANAESYIDFAGNQLLLHSGASSHPTIIHRNDASNYYILLSAAGTTPSGTWNALRPLTIALTSGAVSMSNGVTVAGGLGTDTLVASSTISATGLAGSLLSSATPLVDGTAASGTSAIPARQDHVHPTDTSRLATSSTSTYSMTAGSIINTATQNTTFQVFQPTAGSDSFMQFHISGDYAVGFGLDGTTNDLSVGGWSMGAVKYKVWHAGNDGSGSGLDADTVDGLQVATGTNNVANQIVRTDGNGYIQAGWINTISGDNGTTAITRVYASSDGYIRYYTPSNFISLMGITPLSMPIRTTALAYVLGATAGTAESGQLLEVSAAVTVTVPLDSTTNFPVGTQITVLQTTANQVTLGFAVGVTLNGTPGLKLRAQWSSATLIKRAANVWVAIGDLAA